MTERHSGGQAAEPYRDPDRPILAVLAAADAAEPRVRLVGDGALIHARYEAPTGRCGEREAVAHADEVKALAVARVAEWWRRQRGRP